MSKLSTYRHTETHYLRAPLLTLGVIAALMYGTSANAVRLPEPSRDAIVDTIDVVSPNPDLPPVVFSFNPDNSRLFNPDNSRPLFLKRTGGLLGDLSPSAGNNDPMACLNQYLSSDWSNRLLPFDCNSGQ